MPRKQINVSVDPEEYEAIKAEADALSLTVSRYCRDVLLDSLPGVDDMDEVDDLDDADASAVRAWVLATLALLHLTKRQKPRSSPR